MRVEMAMKTELSDFVDDDRPVSIGDLVPAALRTIWERGRAHRDATWTREEIEHVESLIKGCPMTRIFILTGAPTPADLLDRAAAHGIPIRTVAHETPHPTGCYGASEIEQPTDDEENAR
jgi:hypothetical protein